MKLEDGQLLLCGYMPMFSDGFTIPCYGRAPNPNVWHSAICTVQGDHSGYIADFDEFESTAVHRLPEAKWRVANVGSPWIDVFRWNGDVYVGTPEEIWTSLRGERDSIAEAMPLSLLDIALQVSSSEQAGLIDRAARIINVRFGRAAAERWRYNALPKQQVILGLRRLAKEARLHADVSKNLGRVEVYRGPGESVSFGLPKDVIGAFSDAGLFPSLGVRADQSLSQIHLQLGDVFALEDVDDPERGAEGSKTDAVPEWLRTAKFLVGAFPGPVGKRVGRNSTTSVIEGFKSVGVQYFSVPSAPAAKRVLEVDKQAVLWLSRRASEKIIKELYNDLGVRTYFIRNEIDLDRVQAGTNNAPDLTLLVRLDRPTSPDPREPTQPLSIDDQAALLKAARAAADALGIAVDVRSMPTSPASFVNAMEVVRAAIVHAAVTVDIVHVGAYFPGFYKSKEVSLVQTCIDALHRAFEDLPVSYSAELWCELRNPTLHNQLDAEFV